MKYNYLGFGLEVEQTNKTEEHIKQNLSGK
jgi:hypothetical protein